MTLTDESCECGGRCGGMHPEWLPPTGPARHRDNPHNARSPNDRRPAYAKPSRAESPRQKN